MADITFFISMHAGYIKRISETENDESEWLNRFLFFIGTGLNFNMEGILFCLIRIKLLSLFLKTLSEPLFFFTNHLKTEWPLIIGNNIMFVFWLCRFLKQEICLLFVKEGGNISLVFLLSQKTIQARD